GIFDIFQPFQKGWCYSQAQKTCNGKRRTPIRSAAFLLSEQHYGYAGVFYACEKVQAVGFGVDPSQTILLMVTNQ
ncbi:MAG: hypothetical protein VX301_07100, partial [Pseudomonadota bacterium]|nr:hypothetical protein [Pseudomonadota bacterium]